MVSKTNVSLSALACMLILSSCTSPTVTITDAAITSIQAPATGRVGEPIPISLMASLTNSCLVPLKAFVNVDDNSNTVTAHAQATGHGEVCYLGVRDVSMQTFFTPSKPGTYTIVARNYDNLIQDREKAKVVIVVEAK